MAILPILTYPNPILKMPCQPITKVDNELLNFIVDLKETMDNAPGCVGIAAPQVGVLKQVIIVNASRNPKASIHHGELILINPFIEWQAGEVIAREGCLSLPHLTANVKRAKQIRFRTMQPDGSTISIECSDFEARVVLHETDHLQGLLFLDRVSSLKTDVFRRKTYESKKSSAFKAEV